MASTLPESNRFSTWAQSPRNNRNGLALNMVTDTPRGTNQTRGGFDFVPAPRAFGRLLGSFDVWPAFGFVFGSASLHRGEAHVVRVRQLLCGQT